MFNSHMEEKEKIHEIRKITTDKNKNNHHEEIKEEKKINEEEKEPQTYRPKKAKLHKPIADYEFEYDDMSDENE